MKKAKIMFWIATTLIFLFEGVMPAFTSHTPMAVEGITHLGYPYYFITLLTVFKVLGAIVLMVPAFSNRVKEWAYAGFGIDFICAFVSILVVDGMIGAAVVPLIAMVLLVISYVSRQKMLAR